MRVRDFNSRTQTSQTGVHKIDQRLYRQAIFIRPIKVKRKVGWANLIETDELIQQWNAVSTYRFQSQQSKAILITI